MRCPNCKTEFDSLSCPVCGYVPTESRCPNCGAVVSDMQNHCENCGAPLAARPNVGLQSSKKNQILGTIAKILALVSTITYCLAGLLIVIEGLVLLDYDEINAATLILEGIVTAVSIAWMLPMTLKIWRSVNRNLPLTKKFKILCIIFLSVPVGILLLCMDAPIVYVAPAETVYAEKPDHIAVDPTTTSDSTPFDELND